MRIPTLSVVLSLLSLASVADGATLVIGSPQCAGMSGFRGQWDLPIPVAEDGQRLLKDSVVKDRGQTAVWDGVKPGPLAFDAVHRSLLIRFPSAAEQIARALADGQAIDKVELVLPYLDEEIWPTGSGGADFPCADGYRYRPNWDCDNLYRGVVREDTAKNRPGMVLAESRPNWHAVAQALRRPWQANAAFGPTYNAAVKDVVYWTSFGASDEKQDRFPGVLGPAEVSSYHPEGRLDVTAALTDPAYGRALADRLRQLADCGFVVRKQEVYDARYFLGAYEWAISSGPRAILIRPPSLVVTLKPGPAQRLTLPAPANIAAVAARLGEPQGRPTAVVPGPAQVARLNERFAQRPAWMPEWQYQHVRQLMGLESGGQVLPFYYRLVPQHVVNRARETAEREAKANSTPVDVDHAVYLAWLDWINGRPPRFWEGHLTGAENVTQWYNYRDAIPAPVQASILLCWNAWLMPDRETELDPTLRRQYDNTSGRLVHPMVDDPRVGRSKDGKQAEWNQGDTYYRLTGDWRGNKSYYRSGFTREMSTANFNSSASSGALLNGQIIGSQRAMADGRAGLMQFPFWLWTHSAGVGQEYIDHYYWAIATAANKNFADFCAQPEDQMAGWSIITKTVNDLAGGYHPNLRKLLGPASRTYYEHVLGQQDGLYHILHVLSPRGVLTDTETGQLPALTAAKDANGNTPQPISAWGHDYPAANVALQTMSGPWADPWLAELVDDKPLPWSLYVEKEGDPVCTYFGENYGLTSIRSKPQRLHMLAQWRRKPAAPSTMRDIGTLELRVGFNQTQIANDGEGVISQQGLYRCYQNRNTLVMLARPQPAVIAQQAAEHQFGSRKLPAQEIRSVQCTAALFNYEQPRATWELFADDQKIESLPATARQGQTILIHDGVSYLALRALPTDDLGRDADITLEVAGPQTQPYHEGTNIQPALLVHANFYRRAAAIDADTLRRLGSAQSGFVVEMGDETEYGSFAAFRQHIQAARLAGERGTVTYTTGQDTWVTNWDGFTLNGADPYAYAKQRQLWQDTTLTQMGRASLAKNGATLTRGKLHPELNALLQTFPRQKLYVAANLLPNYLDYSFSEPGGVRISADGACSMGRWAVRDSREVDIRYHAFGGEYLPQEKDAKPASALFISGAKAKPRVTLNGIDVTSALRPGQQAGADGWWVALGGGRQ